MKILRFSVLLSVALALGSCSKTPSPSRHEHRAPHGGTPVALGNEAYHLELVLDAATGKLTAYVLDGEMENFVRVPAASFEIVATAPGAPEKRSLVFRAVANTATGETVGDTSQFETQAEWLKITPIFGGTLVSLEVKKTVFNDVAFNFPRGNDAD